MGVGCVSVLRKLPLNWWFVHHCLSLFPNLIHQFGVSLEGFLFDCHVWKAKSQNAECVVLVAHGEMLLLGKFGQCLGFPGSRCREVGPKQKMGGKTSGRNQPNTSLHRIIGVLFVFFFPNFPPKKGGGVRAESTDLNGFGWGNQGFAIEPTKNQAFSGGSTTTKRLFVCFCCSMCLV